MSDAFFLISLAMFKISCCFADKYKMAELFKKEAAILAAKTGTKGAIKAGKSAYGN